MGYGFWRNGAVQPSGSGGKSAGKRPKGADSGHEPAGADEEKKHPERVVRFTSTDWVVAKLEYLAKSQGPYPQEGRNVAEQILRERLAEMFREEWEPVVFPHRKRSSQQEGSDR